jgi:hypothetical protein
MGEPGLYLEMAATGYVGLKIGNCLYVGVAVGYNRLDMGDRYGSAGSTSFGCGAILVPSHEWKAYASVNNAFESEIVSGTGLHRELGAGVAVTRFEDVTLAVGMCYRSGDDVRYKIGETYRISSALSVSAAVMTSPFVASFGFTLAWRTCGLHYAYRHHPELGGTHIWGITLSR